LRGTVTVLWHVGHSKVGTDRSDEIGFAFRGFYDYATEVPKVHRVPEAPMRRVAPLRMPGNSPQQDR